MANTAPIMGAPSRAPISNNPYFRSYRAPILGEVEDFLRRTGVTATQFGEEALGDPGLVRQLREGRDPRSKTVAIIRRYMEGCGHA